MAQTSLTPSRNNTPSRNTRRDLQSRSSSDPVFMLRSDIDRAIDSFWRAFDMPIPGLSNTSLLSGDVMPVNIRDMDNQVEITAELPGLEPDEIDVTVSDDSITISADAVTERDDSGNGYILQEREVASFERTIPLPDGVDPEGVQASYRNGVLRITLPKTADAQNANRRVPVQSGQ
jgi:HSP20 family protein